MALLDKIMLLLTLIEQESTGRARLSACSTLPGRLSSISIDGRHKNSSCKAPVPTVEQRAVAVIDPCPANARLLLKDSGSVALTQQFAQHDEASCASAHDCLPQLTVTLNSVLGHTTKAARAPRSSSHHVLATPRR